MKVQQTLLISCGVSKYEDFRRYNLQQQMENYTKKNTEEVQGNT